ncbi:MAG: DUF1294 domain-containing protein [Lachnospiraceae bacterium]|nr:DUF1294 domain-containing protein [Lachnospiraceae bacterium]
MEEIMYIIFVAYLVVINLIAFAIMGLDKNYAAKGKWRIPEKTLFLPVLLGGGIGGVLGMRVFRHKTKHWYFAIGFPLIMVIEYALLIYVFATI